MGLLDIFSKSYFTNKRAEERADMVQGLIGQPGMVGADDGLGLSMQPGQIGTPGTGLLGGQMTQPQFAAQLMGIPGYQTHGTSMMNNQFSNQAAMQRQQQGQDFSLNNMTAYQQAQVEQAKQQLDMNRQQDRLERDRMKALGGYSGLSGKMQALNTEANAYEKNVTPYRVPIEYASRANQIVTERGGVQNMTPADDQLLVVSFQKMMKQNESVMGEDFTTTVNNRGGKDYIEGMYNTVINGNALTETQRVDITNLINDIADWYKPEYVKRRDTAERRAEVGNLNPGSYMQPSLEFERMGRLTRPDDKEPATNVNGGKAVGGFFNNLLGR